MRRALGYLLPAAFRAAVPALVIGCLPLLLKPAPHPLTFPDAPFTRLDASSGTLPRPAAVNFYTCCGPCRSEMPLLLAKTRHDPHPMLLNGGEHTATIKQFLSSGPAQVWPDQVWQGGEHITPAIRVSGFPTTLVINSAGQVTARHPGPLNRAQLPSLQR